MKIIFLNIIAFFIYSTAISQIEISKYINENKYSFCAKDSQLFKKEFLDYKFFALGEAHYFDNYNIFLKYTKYFIQNNNVRIVFLEEGYARGVLINNFLKTGNSEMLHVFSAYNGDECKNQMLKLKSLYDELPENEKFEVFGVDFDHKNEDYLIFKTILFLMPETEPPIAIQKVVIDYKETHLPYDFKLLWGKFEILNKDITKNTIEYETYLGKNFQTIKIILDRAMKSKEFQETSFEFTKDTIITKKREEFIYKNTLNVIQTNPNVNYLAKYGLVHIGLKEFVSWEERERTIKSFISMLNSESSLKNKICSFTIYYKKIGLFYPLSKKEQKLIFSTIGKTKGTEDNLFFIKLNKNNSPFEYIAKNRFQYFIYTK